MIWHFFGKNFVKTTFLLKKLPKNWFDEIFFLVALYRKYHCFHEKVVWLFLMFWPKMHTFLGKFQSSSLRNNLSLTTYETLVPLFWTLHMIDELFWGFFGFVSEIAQVRCHQVCWNSWIWTFSSQSLLPFVCLYRAIWSEVLQLRSKLWQATH